MSVIYIKYSEMPNEGAAKCGKKGEIPDKMIVDPRLGSTSLTTGRGDDEEGGHLGGNSQGLTVTRVSTCSNGSGLW